MYTRILVPLDGSLFAEQALPYAKLLAKAIGSSIGLLRVVEPLPPNLADSGHGVYPHRVSESYKSHAEDYLEGIASELRAEGVDTSWEVHEGDPASSIVRDAENTSDTMIAMSSHGRSGITRWLMGSVARKVLHGVSCPTLIVRQSQKDGAGQVEPGSQLSSIVAPLDRSKASEQALPHVAALAKALDTKVDLLWAFPSVEGRYTDLGLAATTYGVATYGEVSKEIEVESQRYFAGIVERLSTEGISNIDTHLLWDYPSSAIVDFAKENPHSLVVMTSHGHSGFGRWVLGSVTDRVVSNLESPVLVIPAVDQA